MRLFFLLIFSISLFADNLIVDDIKIGNQTYHIVSTKAQVLKNYDIQEDGSRKFRGEYSLYFVNLYGNDSVSKKAYKSISTQQGNRASIYYLIKDDELDKLYFDVYFTLDEIKAEVKNQQESRSNENISKHTDNIKNNFISLFNKDTFLYIAFIFFLTIHNFFTNRRVDIDAYSQKGIILQVAIIGLFFISYESDPVDEIPLRYYFGTILIIIFLFGLYARRGSMKEFDDLTFKMPVVYTIFTHKNKFDELFKKFSKDHLLEDGHYHQRYIFSKDGDNQVVIYRTSIFLFIFSSLILMGLSWVVYKTHDILLSDINMIFIPIAIGIFFIVNLMIFFSSIPLKKEIIVFDNDIKMVNALEYEEKFSYDDIYGFFLKKIRVHMQNSADILYVGLGMILNNGKIISLIEDKYGSEDKLLEESKYLASLTNKPLYNFIK